MSAETGTVWIGLRSDGVELARVAATCTEVSRSNGVAKFKTLGAILFEEIPRDIHNPLATVSDSENGRPFAAGNLDSPRTFYAGSSLTVTDFNFDQVLDVPRYTKPPDKPKRRRIRLGN